MRFFDRLHEDIAAVRARDPAARGSLEVLLVYPGVHAVLWHRLAHRVWKAEWRFLARFIAYVARGLTNVDIHPGATIGRRLFIDHAAGVVIGETAEIGDDVMLYHGVTLGGATLSKGKRHPTLADGVMIGAGAKVLGPVRLGRFARVGANSVVLADVPASATVVGVPGRVVLPDARRLRIAGFDLDHHTVPDPVGQALACLLDRVATLEKEVARLGGRIPDAHDCGAACDSHCLGADPALEPALEKETIAA